MPRNMNNNYLEGIVPLRQMAKGYKVTPKINWSRDFKSRSERVLKLYFSRLVFAECPVWMSLGAVHVIGTKKIKNT
jgi:hypothetical protein